MSYLRFIDWQAVIVALAVLAACGFVVRRVWTRLQSVVSMKAGVRSSCARACGGCASAATDTRIIDQKVSDEILRAEQQSHKICQKL